MNRPESNFKSRYTVWQQASVTRARREAMNGHRGVIVWLTGLSGAGKSSLANALEERLHHERCRSFVLDGDNLRHGLCSDLDFSAAARTENIRRVGEMARVFVEAGLVTITAFISPFRADRDRVRALVPSDDFIEIYCACSLATCEARDVKGLYRLAREGKIAEFTGISSPYEAPLAPELVIDTEQTHIDAAVDRVMLLLYARGVCHAPASPA